MDAQKVVCEVDCISHTIAVLGIIKTHLRYHVKINRVIDIGVERLLALRKLSPKSNASRRICMRVLDASLRFNEFHN